MEGTEKAERFATFRLGQMDFQQSAADMLEDAAKQADGLVASTLLHASALVRDMKIPEKGVL